MGLAVRLKIETEDVTEGMVLESIASILSSTRLLSLATSFDDGTPTVCNAYFAFDEWACLYVLTPPSTDHITNLERRPAVAVSVADSQQTGDAGKQGIQMQGLARLASDEALVRGLAAYRQRFPATKDSLASAESMEKSGMESRLFVIEPRSFKIFDEPMFGEENWISATVAGNQLT
jgi:uncharacterized protein YhbP (UPF0306 family)